MADSDFPANPGSERVSDGFRQAEGATDGDLGARGGYSRGDGPLPAWDRWREDLAAVPPQRVAMVGGAAALGVMVGAAATRMLREMR